MAVFDDVAFGLLAPEMAEQVTAVRQALRDALQSRDEEALKQVSTIPRGSSLSEWRLFIRGLVDWLSDERDAAGEVWKRLDPERRPGRVAAAMTLSLRTDLEQAKPTSETPSSSELGGSSPSAPWDRFDDQLLYHAKLLRRVRFERAALKVAESGLAIAEEAKDLYLGPRKMKWVKRFIEEYKETEPELTAAISKTALGRAYAQNYSDLFADAIAKFTGPRHDPRNLLLSYFYHGRFGYEPSSARLADQTLDDYLERDLPRNESITDALRGAIAGQIHLDQAQTLMEESPADSMFARMFARREDTESIRDHLKAATDAAPENVEAHKVYVQWVRTKLDNDGLDKSDREEFEEELAVVMSSWSRGAPNDLEPRLWLVDHLMENEQLTEAQPHVDFLASTRHEDPRARAIPWKWRLLEAMRLCRRKAWLSQVPTRLDEADAMWPTWLPKTWAPYLRAGWLLRRGDLEAFAEARKRLLEETGRPGESLADAVMMLSAAQATRATGPELKPLRESLDRALNALGTLPLDDLLETGSFQWDLIRARLTYPAYRMHARQIGETLFARLDTERRSRPEDANDERIQKATLWGSESRWWSKTNNTKLPPFLAAPAFRDHPIYVAARLNSLFGERYPPPLSSFRKLGSTLREAAQSERNAYYRFWFVELADRLEEAIAKQAQRRFDLEDFFSSRGQSKNDAFDYEDDDDEFDDDEDDLGFDEDCDCPSCTAARQAYERATANKPK